jgi:hypothetical protein
MGGSVPFSEEMLMSLAQVVHQMSTDNDFASQWRVDPEGALAKTGFRLSQEEFAFLKAGLKRRDDREVRLSDLARQASGWRD